MCKSSGNKKYNSLIDFKIEIISKKKLHKPLSELLKFLNKINFTKYDNYFTKKISNELVAQGNILMAKKMLILYINKKLVKIKNQTNNVILRNCFNILLTNKRFSECHKVIDLFNDDISRNQAISNLTIEFSKTGEISAALNALKKINCSYSRDKTLYNINLMLIKNKELDNALILNDLIENDQQKVCSSALLSTEFAKTNNIEKCNELLKIALKINEKPSRDPFAKSETILCLIKNLNIQGKKKHADLLLKNLIQEVKSIPDNFLKSVILKEISVELLKQGHKEESNSIKLEALRKLSSIDKINSFFLSDFIPIINLNKTNILKFINRINDKLDKIKFLQNISSNLKKYKVDDSWIRSESLKIAYSMNDDSDKSEAYQLISLKLGKSGKWDLAQDIALQIPNKKVFQKTWIEMAIINKDNWQGSLYLIKTLLHHDARLYYLKGWTESLDINETNQNLLQNALPYLIHDSEALEVVLQKYAIHETFLGNSTPQQLQRLNQTLDIQWALDIVDSFSEESETMDLSIN